jgi:hypothetical protein
LRSWLSSWPTRSNSKSSSDSNTLELSKTGPYNRLGDPENKFYSSSHIKTGTRSTPNDPYPLNSISVSTTTDIESSSR